MSAGMKKITQDIPDAAARAARLKAALQANIARRKDQARARAADPAKTAPPEGDDSAQE